MAPRPEDVPLPARPAVAAGPLPGAARIQALDVARGVAVLGVLLMNIWAFAGPQAFFDYPLAIADRHGAPVATWAVIHTLFEGSQRTLLSILFGAGAFLVMDRLERGNGPGTARGPYYRRTGVLIAFGLVNAYVFLWPADILFVYGLAGLCLYPLRRRPTPVLLLLAVIALLVPAGLRGLEIAKLGQLEVAASHAAAARDRGELLAADQARALKDWEAKLLKARPDPNAAELAEEIRVMQTGTLAEVARRQAGVSLILQTIVAFKWWFLDALAMMIIGMVLCRSGLLTQTLPRSRYLQAMAAAFLVGLPLAAWQTATLLASDFHPLQVEVTKLSYDLRRFAMAAGYLCLILWFAHGSGGQAVKRALAATGRMALTNYLAQSILCAFIFYGFGLGLYGRLAGYPLYFVVAGIWLLQLGWSPWWLRRHPFGPAEWLWRSLAYRRWQPWRRNPAPAAA